MVLISLQILLFTSLIILFMPISSTIESAVCKNNGTLSVSGKKWTCICPHPFTGKICEDYTCVNGMSTGDQFDPQSIFFNKRCLCDAGWTGTLCRTSLINRCGDHGIEINGKCKCNKNFVGDRCQYVTRCINGQLYNGRCACHYGWEGDFCDIINCHQGKADELNKECLCPSKYRGKHCDFCAEPSSSPPPDCAPISRRQMILTESGKFIIFVIVVVLVILTILGILCVLNRDIIFRSINPLKKRTRQAKSDAEIRLATGAGANKPINGAKKIAGKNSKTTFDSPSPTNRDQVSPAEYEQIVPPKEVSDVNKEATSNPSAVSFFLEDKSSVATENTEQQEQTSTDRADAVKKSLKNKVRFSDKRLDRFDQEENESNV